MAPGGASELSSGGGLQAELKEIAERQRKQTPRNPEPDKVELLAVFGDHALCALVRTRNLIDSTAAFREARHAVWIQQILCFRPERLQRWLDEAPKEALPPPRPIVALVLIKLRDDALLQDSHLLPVAFIESIQQLTAKYGVECEPWLTVGPADVLFIVRGARLDKIGQFMNRIRRQKLGSVFSAPAGGDKDTPCRPFTEALRRHLRLTPTRELDEWFQENQLQEPHSSAEDLVKSLEIVSSSRTILGFDRAILDNLIGACSEIGDDVWRDPTITKNPVSLVEGFCKQVFAPGSKVRDVLSRANIDDDNKYPVSLKVQIKPGSGPALEAIFGPMRCAMLASEGHPVERDSDASRVRSTFGVHDAVLLGPDTRVRFGTVAAAIALVHHLSTADPLLRRRIRHLMRCTLTRFEFHREVLTEGVREIRPFASSAGGEGQYGLLSDASAVALDELSLELPRPEKVQWLPGHIFHAVERLVRLFNAGLRDIATGVHLLDLLPSMQTLVMIVSTGQMVMLDSDTEEAHRLTWQSLPWLHGGHAMREVYQERAVVKHIVRLIDLLELALRQRLQQRLTEHSGDISIELAGGRHKWLSGIAVLVPALQEQIIPHPDVFRWPGLCLLKLIERPIEVFIRFAIVQVSPDVFDNPESLLWLYQELGQVALESQSNMRAVRSLRDAVEALHLRGDARELHVTLRELFGDLALLFQGFDGDLEAYGRFVVVRLARLAPRALPYRNDVWERLFLLTFLVDSDSRWSETFEGRLSERRRSRKQASSSHPGAADDASRLRPLSLEEDIDAALPRFAAMIKKWCFKEEDPWGIADHLLETASPDHRSWTGPSDHRLRAVIARRYKQTAVDVFGLLTPERLAEFRIGHRTVAVWVSACQRKARERSKEQAPSESRPTFRPTEEVAQKVERPAVMVRNLQWEALAPRVWPGLSAETDPASQIDHLASAAFPLVVPADITGWRRDARILAEADCIGDHERVALLQSLWSASQGLKHLLLNKVRIAETTGLRLDAIVQERRRDSVKQEGADVEDAQKGTDAKDAPKPPAHSIRLFKIYPAPEAGSPEAPRDDTPSPRAERAL